MARTFGLGRFRGLGPPGLWIPVGSGLAGPDRDHGHAPDPLQVGEASHGTAGCVSSRAEALPRQDLGEMRAARRREVSDGARSRLSPDRDRT